MAQAHRSPAREVTRFLSSVLMVTGALLILDAVVTVAWQEPISSFFANRQQSRLGDALATPPRRVIERKPLRGDAIGRITLPTQDRSYYVIEGTDTADLRKGPGHYSDTPLPGRRGTVAIAGHRTTYLAPFRQVDKLKRGDRVIVDMTYGRFTYRVEKTRIVKPEQTEVKRRVGHDRLVLTACHPLYSAAQRIVVFARFAGRGPSRLKRG
ncbi:MAG: class E sortase [Thermoleophilaceae bacterium]|nr:class E sortase [Thermoleophilaceae bacterium]